MITPMPGAHISKPWPGMMRTMWNDHDRFIDTYFAIHDDMYFTGDGCRIDQDIVLGTNAHHEQPLPRNLSYVQCT